MTTARERERLLESLSDDELVIWYGQAGTAGLPRRQVERLVWLIGHLGQREAAPPRRMSRWEWQRLHEAMETIAEIESERVA